MSGPARSVTLKPAMAKERMIEALEPAANPLASAAPGARLV